MKAKMLLIDVSQDVLEQLMMRLFRLPCSQEKFRLYKILTCACKTLSRSLHYIPTPLCIQKRSDVKVVKNYMKQNGHARQRLCALTVSMPEETWW